MSSGRRGPTRAAALDHARAAFGALDRVADVLDPIFLLAYGVVLTLYVAGDHRLTWTVVLSPLYGFVRFVWLLFSTRGRRRLLILTPALLVVVVAAHAVAPSYSRWMLRWDLEAYRRIAVACREASPDHGYCNLPESDQKLVDSAHIRNDAWGRTVWLNPLRHAVYLAHVPDPAIEARALEEERCATPFEPGWILVYRC